jgi:hypothetical protein
MAGENGGELAGFLGEMLMGGLEAMAEGREGQGRRREGRAAGREALGQIVAHQMHQMPEYMNNGAPYGATNEGLMRWISERAAAATAAAAESLAAAASLPVQAAPRAQNHLAQGGQIRSFAEHEQIRSFAEHERIRSFAEHEQV